VNCESCSQPATVHLTDIVNGLKREVHLCQECAEKRQILQNNELNLSAILQTVIGQHVGPVSDELARLACPACGIQYMDFRAEGRLGCPHDYAVFRAGLGPILRRIHRAERHCGKTPRRASRSLDEQAELIRLRQELRRAVEAEAYEQAARLRDLLRQKEASNGPG
jgi:protein arginine kinase activator